MNTEHPKPGLDGTTARESSAIRSRAESGQQTFPAGAIPTELLFHGNPEILISHHGEHYRLRITRNGKLILTK